MVIELLFAALAGVLTVLAPCILPMLPILLGSTFGHQEPIRPFLIVAGFILTFCATVLVFSLVSSLLGLSPQALRDGAAILILLFGLAMIWPAPYEWAIAQMQGLSRNGAVGATSGPAGALLVGASLGLVWTPCAGPVLGSILALAATSPNLASTGLLLFAYAIGAGIPMLAIAYGGQLAARNVHALSRYTRTIQILFGIATIIVAISMLTGYDTLLIARLSAFYPDGRVGL